MLLGALKTLRYRICRYLCSPEYFDALILILHTRFEFGDASRWKFLTLLTTDSGGWVSQLAVFVMFESSLIILLTGLPVEDCIELDCTLRVDVVAAETA